MDVGLMCLRFLLMSSIEAKGTLKVVKCSGK